MFAKLLWIKCIKHGSIGMAVSSDQLVHHSGPDWNTSTTIRLISMEFVQTLEDKTYWLWWFRTLLLVPPWGWHLWFRVKYFDNYWIGCCEICYRYSRSPQDEMWWLWWSLNFFPLAPSSGQNWHLSSILVYDQIPSKLITLSTSALLCV